MPFGLTNAPAVFQALVNDILRDMLNHFFCVYLDNIFFLFSKSEKEPVQHTQQVLQQLLENQLFVKAEKYKFHQQSVSVLGFIVAPSSIQMDPVKVSDGLACSHRQKEAAQIFGLCKFYVS